MEQKQSQINQHFQNKLASNASHLLLQAPEENQLWVLQIHHTLTKTCRFSKRFQGQYPMQEGVTHFNPLSLIYKIPLPLLFNFKTLGRNAKNKVMKHLTRIPLCSLQLYLLEKLLPILSPLNLPGNKPLHNVVLAAVYSISVSYLLLSQRNIPFSKLLTLRLVSVIRILWI